MRPFLLVPATLLALLPLGCGATDPQANEPGQYGQQGQYGQPGQQGQYGQPQPGQYAQPQPGQYAQPQPGQYGQPQPGQYAQPQPGQYAQPGQYGQPQPGQYAQPQPGYAQPGQPAPAAGGPATPIPAGAAAAAGPILMGLGASEAQGAQPEGGPFAGQFQEGQSLEQVINIAPNKCYTIVATGMGVQQLDIQLVVQPFPMVPPQVIAQSQPGGGPMATLGGKTAGCWRNPAPFGGPAKVVLRATRGAGMAAAQVYSK